jgi:hypothetical protein
MKKKKGYAMGGMMPMDQKKINPTTGLAMNKGGMSKKKKGMAKGGMMKKKGMAKGGMMKKKGMAKGGMTDMRKTGMFYGGGMARKK